MSVGPQAPKKPFSPQPARPKLRVRLEDDGPFVDLGISYSELIVGILDTLDDLCTDSGVDLDGRIKTALDNLNVHRPGGKGAES